MIGAFLTFLLLLSHTPQLAAQPCEDYLVYGDKILSFKRIHITNEFQIEIASVDQADVLIIKPIGRVSIDTLMPSLNEILSAEYGPSNLNILADLSQANLVGLSVGSVNDLKDRAASIYRKFEIDRVRVAIYAPSDLAFGFSRMYEMLNTSETVFVSRTREAAIDWLGFVGRSER